MRKEKEPLERHCVLLFESDVALIRRHFKAFSGFSTAVRYAVRQVADGLRHYEKQVEKEREKL